ncbi:transposon Ty3-G Gag-Pol polyprotein [Trichonephila clavata]|uniref:Transposon Ty3-G Gag-Pol polyprotein n=1 Tax=Trichonephila clavata TaxID=2740835 RepID=A0A8X6LIT0_TRICU|nr:transposon Ty3-G Gag-Pol polyprotein [Trichonephila clavata]
MYTGLVEPLDGEHLCVTSDTSHVPDMKHEMSDGNKRQGNPLMISPELNQEQKNQLPELHQTVSEIFTKTDKSTTTGANMKLRINTGNHAPINQRAYQVSPTWREVQKILEKAETLPLLLKGDAQFYWSSEEIESFEILKRAPISEPVLGMYDENVPTEIHTDASGYGIGAVLVPTQNKVEKVLAYVSRTLTKAEKNYSLRERECLAIVWALNKPIRKHFTIVTNHHALFWLMDEKDPSGRMAKWASLRVSFFCKLVRSIGHSFKKSCARRNF